MSRKHRGRRWFLGAAFSVGLLLAAYFFFQDSIVNARFRPIIESALTKAIQSPVSITSVRVGLLGDIDLQHVSMTIPGEPWEVHLKVDQIAINLELFNLLFHRKTLENCIENLSLSVPQAVLVKKEPAPSSPTGPVTGETALPPKPKVPIPLIPVPRLIVRNGSFSVQAGKSPRAILNRLNFEATNTKGPAWGLSLEAHSPELNSNGIIRFNGSLQLEDLKIAGKLLLEQWPLVSAGSPLKDLSGWEVQSGMIDAEMPIVFRMNGGLWFDAKANLRQASIRSPNPVGVIFSNITGRVFIRPNELSVPGELIFQTGETLWSATGLIPFDNRPIAIKTTTKHLFLSSVFTELLKLKNLKVDGNGSATLVAAGPLDNPVIEGTAQLGESHVGDWQLDSLSVKAGYKKGVLRLYEANGKLYDGELTSNGFVPLTGEKSAPVSLRAILKEVEAEKVAATLGISGMKGKSDVEVHVGGTMTKPLVSATSQTTLARTLRNSTIHYSLRNTVQLRDQTLEISSTINDKTRLECEFVENPEDWSINKFSLVTGKKIEKLTAKGIWPKSDQKPIDLQLKGRDLSLQDIPFFSDQFPDVSGKVALEAQMSGTRKDPKISAHLSSLGVKLGNLDPEPMNLVLNWKRGNLEFEKLTVGDIFSVSGELGLAAESPLDLKIHAQGIPLQTIAEISSWDNPPQPFGGWVTGRLHFSGLRKNPILESDGLIQSLKIGDWSADRVETLLSLEQGKLQFKKLKLTQGENSLAATGWLDTRLTPSLMSLHFSAHHFQLGKGPSLSGDFQWDAKTTGDPWFEYWEGTFSSIAFSIVDLKNKTYHFTDFSTSASCENLVFKGNVHLGKSVSGTAVLDASVSPVKLQALLKVEPTLLSDEPELTQFLPASLKASGKISGQLRLKEGILDVLPMDGKFIIADGAIQKYDFDRMEFSLEGNKAKISPAFTLVRDQAKYLLTGVFESPKAFWDSDSKITLNGPFQGEKLANLLSLLGVNVEKHKVAGQVDGKLSVTGTLTNPTVGFSMTGENLRYDDKVVPSAELNFSESNGKILLQKNNVSLTKGEIDLDGGSLYLDPKDPTLVVLDLSGATKDLPIAIFNLTSQIRLTGQLALEEKEERPTFSGRLSIVETSQGSKSPVPFDVDMTVHKKVVDFKPIDNLNAQLVGRLDLSQDQKIIFKNLHLENSKGQFSVDGILDLVGSSQLVADAKDIPIQEVGKWFRPNFPLSGTGSYHLIFDGTLENPLFTSSFNVSGGKIGDLQFDLLDGEIKGKDNTLFLGDAESPLTMSRAGLFTFTVDGKMPLALTKAAWIKVHNREMDINANMEKGDFSLILLAGVAKKASGQMDFSAHVGGTLDDPILTMDLGLQKCSLVPNMVAQSIEDLSGRIKVRDNKLAVEDLNGRIGQGRVFITSPPIEQSKMLLVNFIPQFLDFQVQTVGDHGVWLSIPTIMAGGEWGEIYFSGASPKEPMLIRGTLQEPHVIGTALLDTGHYTFPPVEAKDANGAKIEYRELAGVFFELNLKSGKNTWYSNDFNGNYIELKVNPGDQITLNGKDADRTPEEAGIKCYGSAGAKDGWLRYFGHEFKLQEASLFMSKGKPPTMQGHATDRFLNAEVVSAAGTRKTDVDVWVDFKGTFGDIKFTFDSSPRFSTDSEMAQKILLSNIIFGRDMTGLSREDLKQAYDQNAGGAITKAGLEALENIANAKITSALRPLTQPLGIGEVDFEQHILSTDNGNPSATPGIIQSPIDSLGNSLSGASVPIARVIVRRPIDRRLSLVNTFGITRDLTTDKAGVQEQLALNYDLTNNLKLSGSTGQRDDGQYETKGTVSAHWTLPDIMQPKKGDKEKPHFERFDIFSLGPGKFQLIWVTDKVTKSEVKVLDSDNQLFRDIPENKQPDYRHELVIDGLNPEVGYTIQISVKDLNQNESVDSKKTSPASN